MPDAGVVSVWHHPHETLAEPATGDWHDLGVSAPLARSPTEGVCLPTSVLGVGAHPDTLSDGYPLRR